MKISLHPYIRPKALIFTNGSVYIPLERSNYDNKMKDRKIKWKLEEEERESKNYNKLFILEKEKDKENNNITFYSLKKRSIEKIDHLLIQLLSHSQKIFCHSSSLSLFQFFLLHSSIFPYSSSFSSRFISFQFPYFLNDNFYSILDIDTFTNSFWYGSFGYSSEKRSEDALSKFKKRYSSFQYHIYVVDVIFFFFFSLFVSFDVSGWALCFVSYS